MAATLRGQVTTRFYQAFYEYSSITLAQHPPKRFYTLRAKLTPDTIRLLQDNNSALLNRAVAKFGATITISDTLRDDNLHGLILKGPPDACHHAVKFVRSLDGPRFKLERGTASDLATANAALDAADLPSGVEGIKEDFRGLYKSWMRNVPSCPVVLCSALPVVPDIRARVPIYDDRHLHGLTVSSMTSVSLYPHPVVSFNIKTPSRTLDAILATGDVIVHFLANNAAGAQIAHAFAQSHDHPAAPFRSLIARNLVSLSVDKGNKLYMHGDGIVTRFVCQPLDTKVEIADHVVIFAKVRGIDRHPLESPFLAYAKSAYRDLAESHIDPTLPPLPEGASEDMTIWKEATESKSSEPLSKSSAQEDENDNEWTQHQKSDTKEPDLDEPPSSSAKFASAWEEMYSVGSDAEENVSTRNPNPQKASRKNKKDDEDLDDDGMSTYWGGNLEVYDSNEGNASSPKKKQADVQRVKKEENASRKNQGENASQGFTVRRISSSHKNLSNEVENSSRENQGENASQGFTIRRMSSNHKKTSIEVRDRPQWK